MAQQLDNLTGMSDDVAWCMDISEFFALQGLRDLTLKTYIRCIFIIIYSIIFSVAICGNLFIVLAVSRNRALQSVRNGFIVNLSVSDLLVSTASLPVTAYTMLFKVWVFGMPLCYFIPTLQAMSVNISSFTLMFVAIDRYLVICHAQRRDLHIDCRRAAFIIAGIWTTAFLVSMPSVVNFQLLDGPAFNVCGEFCDESGWDPKAQWRQVYSAGMLIAQFLIPLTIIALCYHQIGRALSASLRFRGASGGPSGAGNSRSGQSPSGPPHETTAASSIRSGSLKVPGTTFGTARALMRQPSTKVALSQSHIDRIRRKRKTTTLLILMVVAFACSWAPRVLFNIIIDYNIELLSLIQTQPYFFGITTHCIAMTSTFWNPVFYGFFNETFRKTIPTIVPCLSRYFAGDGHHENRNAYRDYRDRDTTVTRYGNGTNAAGAITAAERSTYLPLEAIIEKPKGEEKILRVPKISLLKRLSIVSTFDEDEEDDYGEDDEQAELVGPEIHGLDSVSPTPMPSPYSGRQRTDLSSNSLEQKLLDEKNNYHDFVNDEATSNNSDLQISDKDYGETAAQVQSFKDSHQDNHLDSGGSDCDNFIDKDSAEQRNYCENFKPFADLIIQNDRNFFDTMNGTKRAFNALEDLPSTVI